MSALRILIADDHEIVCMYSGLARTIILDGKCAGRLRTGRGICSGKGAGTAS